MKKILGSIIVVLFVAICLINCGGGGSSSDTTTANENNQDENNQDDSNEFKFIDHWLYAADSECIEYAANHGCKTWDCLINNCGVLLEDQYEVCIDDYVLGIFAIENPNKNTKEVYWEIYGLDGVHETLGGEIEWYGQQNTEQWIYNGIKIVDTEDFPHPNKLNVCVWALDSQANKTKGDYCIPTINTIDCYEPKKSVRTPEAEKARVESIGIDGF